MTAKTWVFVVLFAVCEAAANWLAARYQFPLLGVLIPGGTLLIPIALILRDAIHLQPKRNVALAWAMTLGVAANCVFGSTATIRVAVASAVAFLVSFLVDSWVFEKAWRYPVPMRMRMSNWASLPTDTVFFVPLAFAGRFPITAIILGQILAKLAMTEVAVMFVAVVRRTHDER